MKTFSSFLLFTFMAASSIAQSARKNGGNGNVSKPVKSSETTAYNSRIYNACTKEWVALTGTVTYTVREMRNDDRYFIMYDIDLSKVTGVGETSGTVYKGGGHIKDKVAASYKNNHVVGNNTYRVKYKAPNASITVTQHSHYVSSKDDTKMSFNDEVESCE